MGAHANPVPTTSAVSGVICRLRENRYMKYPAGKHREHEAPAIVAVGGGEQENYVSGEATGPQLVGGGQTSELVTPLARRDGLDFLQKRLFPLVEIVADIGTDDDIRATAPVPL